MNISIYCFYIFNRRNLLHKMELKCYEMLWNVYVNVRKCTCNIKRESVQLLQKILLTIIRHTQCEKIYQHNHYIFCLLSLQRKQHLLSATVGLIGLLFAAAKLHSVCKTFTLTHSNTEKYKFVNYSRNSVTISFTTDYLWYYCTTKEILVLKQIDCNEYYKTNVASKDYIL